MMVIKENQYPNKITDIYIFKFIKEKDKTVGYVIKNVPHRLGAAYSTNLIKLINKI